MLEDNELPPQIEPYTVDLSKWGVDGTSEAAGMQHLAKAGDGQITQGEEAGQRLVQSVEDSRAADARQQEAAYAEHLAAREKRAEEEAASWQEAESAAEPTETSPAWETREDVDLNTSQLPMSGVDGGNVSPTEQHHSATLPENTLPSDDRGPGSPIEETPLIGGGGRSFEDLIEAAVQGEIAPFGKQAPQSNRQSLPVENGAPPAAAIPAALAQVATAKAESVPIATPAKPKGTTIEAGWTTDEETKEFVGLEARLNASSGAGELLSEEERELCRTPNPPGKTKTRAQFHDANSVNNESIARTKSNERMLGKHINRDDMNSRQQSNSDEQDGPQTLDSQPQPAVQDHSHLAWAGLSQNGTKAATTAISAVPPSTKEQHSDGDSDRGATLRLSHINHSARLQRLKEAHASHENLYAAEMTSRTGVTHGHGTENLSTTADKQCDSVPKSSGHNKQPEHNEFHSAEYHGNQTNQDILSQRRQASHPLTHKRQALRDGNQAEESQPKTTSYGGIARRDPGISGAVDLEELPPTSGIVQRFWPTGTEKSKQRNSSRSSVTSRPYLNRRGEVQPVSRASTRVADTRQVDDVLKQLEQSRREIEEVSSRNERERTALKKREAALAKREAALQQREEQFRQKVKEEERRFTDAQCRWDATKAEEERKMKKAARSEQRAKLQKQAQVSEEKRRVKELSAQVEALKQSIADRESSHKMDIGRLRTQIDKLKEKNSELEFDLHVHEQQRLARWTEAESKAQKIGSTQRDVDGHDREPRATSPTTEAVLDGFDGRLRSSLERTRKLASELTHSSWNADDSVGQTRSHDVEQVDRPPEVQHLGSASSGEWSEYLEPAVNHQQEGHKRVREACGEAQLRATTTQISGHQSTHASEFDEAAAVRTASQIDAEWQAVIDALPPMVPIDEESPCPPLLYENRHPDGKSVREYQGNIRCVTFNNGTRKEIRPLPDCADKRVETVFFGNGDIKQALGDGTVRYFFQSTNTTQVTLPDGSNLFCFKTGQKEYHSVDGSRRIRFPNGSVRFFSSEGVFVGG